MAKTPEVPVAELEFEHSPLEDAIIRHKSKLILVGSLAVIGSLAYFGNKLWTDHKHSVAALDFTRASSVAELQSAADKNPGQPGGGTALVEAARLLAKDNKGREAIEVLEKFLSAYPSHELRGLAEFRLADLKYKEGGLQDAADRFLKLAADSKSPFTPLALLRAGDIRWQEGKTEDAAKLYQEAVTKTGGNQMLMQRLKQVKLAAPALIDYVPEPTPASGAAPTGINVPGLLGDDPAALGGEAPLLPPPAIPQAIPRVLPAPVPPPAAPPVPPPAAAPSFPVTPSTPVEPATPPPATQTPAAPVNPAPAAPAEAPATPPPAVETPAPATSPATPAPAPAGEAPATPPPATPEAPPATK